MKSSPYTIYLQNLMYTTRNKHKRHVTGKKACLVSVSSQDSGQTVLYDL